MLAAASPWRSRISAQPPLGGRRPRPPRGTMKSREEGTKERISALGRTPQANFRVGRPRLPLLPGAHEAPRRGEEPREYRPLPDFGGRAGRGREASPWGMPSRSPGRGPPYWKSRVLRRQALGDQSDDGDHGSKGERAAWPWATRQRNERKRKRGLHRGAAELARRYVFACRTPPRRASPACLRAAGASRSCARARRGRAD